jgi:C4-dicarboxylate-specific signal transduction histidine kinase
VSLFWLAVSFSILGFEYLKVAPTMSAPPEAFLIISLAAILANFSIASIFWYFLYRSNSAMRQSVEDAIKVLRAYASKNFVPKMGLSGVSSPYNTLALGINILGEELFASLEELNKYHIELQSIVDQKTAELQKTQVDLINSSKFATLGEIAGGVAHEINNPLASIILRYGHIRHLIRHGNLDMAQKLIDEAEQTARKIESIIIGLRSFSRSAEEDPIKPTSIHKIVHDSIAMCHELFTYRNIALTIEPFDEGLEAECNGVQLSQIILNLLTNAKQAIEHKTGERWVRLRVTHTDERVRIAITDSGRGIPADIRDKIMQPFFTTKPVGEGTGLGLSISKGIAEKHGGRLYLDVHSPNTQFVLEIPKMGVRSKAA